MMNMKTSRGKNSARSTAALLRALGQPARVRILQGIGEGEACVCHLEALLGLRQAYISQHLMALRDQGLVTTRREGKFIFYRLRDPELLSLIDDAAKLAGVVPPTQSVQNTRCSCPSCSSESESLIRLEDLAA
jgi:DNA-binding transcriptional ArsR family regulator